MRFGYYKRLTAKQKATYRKTDDIKAVAIPGLPRTLGGGCGLGASSLSAVTVGSNAPRCTPSARPACRRRSSAEWDNLLRRPRRLGSPRR